MQVLDAFVRKQQGLSEADLSGLRAAVSSSIEQEYAADIQRLSAFWFDNDDDEEGKDALMVEGYGVLADRLAAGLAVRYKTEVTRITRGSDSVSVSLADGSVLRCRYLVCTLPIGVLKARHTNLFRPPLPDSKIRALRGLDTGLLNKVVLSFPHHFWAQDKAEWLLRVGPPSSLAASASTLDLGFCEFFNLYPAIKKPVLVAFTAGSHAWHVEKWRYVGPSLIFTHSAVQ